jgi:two-component system sensor histidine kinase/response regulator
LLTALASKEHRIKGLELGADDFMPKPFDYTELLARTRSLLRMKSLYDRLQQSYEDLKRVEESKELMTHMIVHDLRSPLMVIQSSLELMSLELKGHFSSNDVIAPANILRACKRMSRLIDNILDVSKMEDGRFKLECESINIPSLFRELIDEHKGEAVAKQTKTHSLVEDNLPQVKADINIIRRVLENLVSNALKSVRDNGEIWLMADFEEVADSVRVSVADNGYGIPPEYLGKIFDKYEQVRMKKKGITHNTGLGLTFCKMAVETHGGKIWVESEPGKGSTITFSLPVSNK